MVGWIPVVGYIFFVTGHSSGITCYKKLRATMRIRHNLIMLWL